MEAAGLGCIEPRVPAVGVGLWRGKNWALHAGIVLGSAFTCDRIETAGARAVGGHSGVRRGLAGMLLTLHTATRASHCVLHCPLCPACLCSRVECLSPNREIQFSRYLTVKSRIEILIGFEFRGILRYKFKTTIQFNLDLQLTKISPPFRISITI